MSKTTDSANGNGAMRAFGPFSAFFTNAMNGNKLFTETALRASQQQALDFIIQRLHHTEEAVEECKACTDPLALAMVQQKWLAETMKDYFEQSAKFGQKVKDAASDGAELASRSRGAARNAG